MVNFATETKKNQKKLIIDNEKDMEKIRLWLDDVRTPPTTGDDNWVWVKTVKDAKFFLEKGMVYAASLDHDLGEGEETGYDLVCWMEETGIWPDRWIRVHSMNPVGKEKMQVVIDKCFRKPPPAKTAIVQKRITKWTRYQMEKIGDIKGLETLDRFEKENDGKYK